MLFFLVHEVTDPSNFGASCKHIYVLEPTVNSVPKPGDSL